MGSNPSLEQSLSQLQLGAMRQHDDRLAEEATAVNLSYDRYLQALVEQEVRCAVVQLAPDVTRLIPIAATDLAAVPPVVFSAPVDLSSLQGLIAAFEGIQATIHEEVHDEPTGQHRPSVPGHPAAGDLGYADHRPTSGGPAAAGQPVSPTARPMESGARR